MTKTHALKRLLEHGPMTRAQIIECTGWTPTAAAKVMSRCVRDGAVKASPGWWPRAYVAAEVKHA